jgi:micrococcal nuclease
VTARRELCTTFFCITFLLLFVTPWHSDAAPPLPASFTGTVTWVYDADTLEIKPHGKVRLLGIDAPEKRPSARDDKFVTLGAPRSQLRTLHKRGLEWCIRTVKGQTVTLSFDRTRRDRHGRLLAYVHLADGRLLNRLLLEEGLVIVYRRFPFRLKQEFLAVEAEARKRETGLWQPSPAATPKRPKQSNSMSNENTLLIHEPRCQGVA